MLMRRRLQGFRRAFVLAFLGLAWLGGCGATAADAPGAEVFGALPVEAGPVLSPDGHWLAWIEHKTPQARVVMFDVEARKVQRILSAPGGTDFLRLEWHNVETLLITTRDPIGSRTLAHDVSGGDGRVLLSMTEYLVASRISKLNTVITATKADNEFTAAKDPSHLKEVDTLSGRSTVINIGDKHTIGWVVDRDGNPVAREDWDWWHRQYRVYALSRDSIKEILRRDDSELPKLYGTLADRPALLLLATNGRGHQAAWALPLNGSPLQLLAEEPGADITGVFTDPYTGSVIGVSVSGAESSMHWLEPAANARYESLARAFPGRLVQPYSWTEDGKRTLVRVSSASSPPVFYLTDFKTHRADIAAEEYPGLAGVTLGDVKEITYRARDGTDIQAYLTTPPGKTAPLPLVVLPHGGPNARDYPGFDPFVQFLATRGYAVLQPQFRGSTGFGDAFRDAGDRQWGGLMQDDVTDGVRAMVAQGTADPRRVCIVGTSGYSGYAALAGGAFTPDLYACAVSINGFSDLGLVLRQTSSGTLFHVVSTSQSVWKKLIGGYGDAKRASPINAVSSIKTPILLMYGGDPYVPADQSQSMARALSGAGKDVTVVTLPQDREWRARTATRVQVLQELEKFLGQHLPRN
jgi:dipeptidyl aminopeptidase/acylaminoacyl peptidase